jgi:hypothetical protein
MEQINSIQGNDGEGPMWGRFWDSFGAQDQHDTESQLSDPLSSQLLSAHSASHHSGHGGISPEPSASFSQLQGFAEITPNESASMVANNDEGRSSMSLTEAGASQQKEDMFSFKFTTAGGKTHRFASVYDSYDALLEAVRTKVIGEHLTHEGANPDDPADAWLSISYLDDEEDQVLITSDADVSDAVKLARKMGQDKVKLFVHDATEKAVEEEVVLTEEPVTVIEEPVTYVPPPAIEVTTEAVKEEKKAAKRRSLKKEIVVESEDESDTEQNTKQGPATIAGLPQELILPAAIAFLGVVIVGIFAFTRVSSNRR